MLKLGRAEVRIGGQEKLGSRARAGSAEARWLKDAAVEMCIVIL